MKTHFQPQNQTQKIFLTLLLFFLVFPTSMALFAQEMEIDSDEVQEKIEQIKASSDLDQETIDKLVDIYEQALAETARASNLSTQAEEFDQLRKDAPERLEELQSELADPTPTYVVETTDPASLDLRRIELETQLKTVQENVKDLEKETKRRSQHRTEAPKSISAAKEEIREIDKQINALESQETESAVRVAQETLLRAKKNALQKEILALENETISHDARTKLLSARRDAAIRRMNTIQDQLDKTQEAITQARKQEAHDALVDAAVARNQLASVHPLAKQIAKDNAEYAEMKTEVTSLNTEVTQKVENIEERKDTIKADMVRVQEKVELAGLTNAIGLMMRKQQAGLPNVNRFRKQSKERQEEISEVQMLLLDLEEKRFALSNIDARVSELMTNAETPIDEERRQEIQTTLTELLVNRKKLLDSLYIDYDRYFTNLVELDTAEKELISTVENFREFINERVLWIKSAPALTPSSLPDAWHALRWLVSPENLLGIPKALLSDLKNDPVVLIASLFVIVASLWFRKKFLHYLSSYSDKGQSKRDESFRDVSGFSAATVLSSIPRPLVLLMFGWRLSSVAETTDYTLAFASGLIAAGVYYLPLEFLKQFFRKKGLGEHILGWDSASVRVLQKNIASLSVIVLPLIVIIWMLGWQENPQWEESLGRIVYIIMNIAFAMFAFNMLRPWGAVVEGAAERKPGGWQQRLRHLWVPTVSGIPLLLAILSAIGYHYMAVQIERRFLSSLALGVALIILNAFALKFLSIFRYRMALAKAEKTEEQPPSDTQTGDIGLSPPQKHEVGIYTFSLQTRKMLRSVIVLTLIIGLWLIWVDIFPALGILKQVTLWNKTVQEVSQQSGTAQATQSVEMTVPVTLADFLFGILLLIMTVVAVRNIPGLMEVLVLQRLSLDHGLRYAIGTVTRYMIVVFGVVFALTVLGVQWSQVQWLAAAMTVGLGFGLQEIFANFVSGLIILFERPMRIGDVVTVGDVTGTVSRIQIRATTVTDWNRKELIVPNKAFITGQLINWSLSDSILRVVIPVGIAYGSDTQLAIDTLLEAAKKNPHVLDYPEPTALFLGFGDSALNLELRVFVSSMEFYLATSHEMHMLIDQAFREANIEISFPQRDIHIRSIDNAIPFVQKEQ